MAILTDRPLEDFPRKVPTSDVLYFVEVTRSTIVGAPKEICLAGWMDEILFRISVGTINDVTGIHFKGRRRCLLIGYGVDEMAGGTADSFHFNLARENLLVDLVYVLWKHSGRISTELAAEKPDWFEARAQARS